MNETIETHSGKVTTGPTVYEVTESHDHQSLKRGDLVRVIETPPAYMSGSHYLITNDFKVHLMTDQQGQYVHLREVQK